MELLGDQAVTLSVYECQSYSFTLWMRARYFLRALYAHVGLPISKVNLDTFFGRYSRTPFGIHKDAVANFSYVVSGAKRMLLWPSEAFENRFPTSIRALGTVHYEQFMDSAIEIEGKPGDLIFWPASYWHLAISDDGWPTTLNIALYLGNNLLQLFHQIFAVPEIASALADFSIPTTIPIPESLGPPRITVPEPVLHQGEVFQALANHTHLRQCSEDRWFRKLSASGFDVVPQPVPTPSLDDSKLVRGSSDFPIFLIPRDSGKAEIFANGNKLEVSMDEQVSSIVDRLNSGTEFSVGELLRRTWTQSASHRVDGVSSDPQRVLEFLCSHRAVRWRDSS